MTPTMVGWVIVAIACFIVGGRGVRRWHTDRKRDLARALEAQPLLAETYAIEVAPESPPTAGAIELPAAPPHDDETRYLQPFGLCEEWQYKLVTFNTIKAQRFTTAHWLKKCIRESCRAFNIYEKHADARPTYPHIECYLPDPDVLDAHPAYTFHLALPGGIRATQFTDKVMLDLLSRLRGYRPELIINEQGVWIDVSLETVRAKPDKCCLLYTSPSPRDRTRSRMPSSA